MTVGVRSTVTGPDSSRVFTYKHTEVPCRRFTWYPIQSLYTDTCSSPLIVNVNQGRNNWQLFCLWIIPTRVRTTDLLHSERTLYAIHHRGGRANALRITPQRRPSERSTQYTTQAAERTLYAIHHTGGRANALRNTPHRRPSERSTQYTTQAAERTLYAIHHRGGRANALRNSPHRRPSERSTQYTTEAAERTLYAIHHRGGRMFL